MDEIRSERLIIVVATLAGIACILQIFFGDWEFWVPGVIAVATVILWALHVLQKLDRSTRISLYFSYAAFLAFYHGIHEESLFDVSLSFALLLATVTITNRLELLNLSVTVYAIVLCVQFYYMYITDTLDLSRSAVTRTSFQIFTIVILYFIGRIAVAARVSEKEKTKKWMEAAKTNDNDMEDFLSNISHELRTPINVISGMTALMQKNYDNKELVSIQEAGVRLANQIEDIQDYTELKRGEIVLEEENYMCVSLINDVVSYYNSIYKENNLELIIDLAPETPSMLCGDIRKFHKIFRHLLDNSIKFTRNGGVYIKVFSVPHEYGVNLTIEVTDTGVGMSRAEISRASKGLYQANKQRNRSTGGIGIGLPIVYGFVHKMGGFVLISSKKGHGTTVRISVPQKVIDSSPCLSIEQDSKEAIVFYIKPDKYSVPEVRDFFRSMAINISSGLKRKLYSVNDMNELEKILSDSSITYIFTGQEEYSSDRDVLDKLSRDGYKVAVSASAGFNATPGSGVLVMPKPLYSFPVVRILNGNKGFEFCMTGEGMLPRFTGVSALIVDDEPMNLVVAGGILREYKMVPEMAESGREAIRKYEDGRYDIIFMDHMMPEMDGVETMKKIREIAAQTGRSPIIVALTANALSGSKEMFIREGFDGFIAKPIDMREFERVMKRVLPQSMIHYERRDDK